MDLKWNKNWEPLDKTISCMDQWLLGYICTCTTVDIVSWRIKTNKIEDYIHKCDERSDNRDNCWKYRKCLPCKTYILLKIPTIKTEITVKRFDLKMIFFGLDYEEPASNRQKILGKRIVFAQSKHYVNDALTNRLFTQNFISYSSFKIFKKSFKFF